MEDQRDRERKNSGSASQAWEELRVVVASVTILLVTILVSILLLVNVLVTKLVTILLVALILLLINPIDDVLVARL